VEAAVMAATGKPIVTVINTGGQDHRWMGNGYFKAKGATLVASAAAVADQKARSNDQLLGLESRLGVEGLAGTDPVHADVDKGDRVFEGSLNMTIGGVDFLMRNVGPAHTPGDSFVWVPGRRIVFTGDIVYVERMLGVLPFSRTATWLDSFDALASLGVVQVVPGHGSPTTLGKARMETRAYLAHLRAEVRKVLDAGGGIEEATAIDQSAFAHLKNFDTLSRRNAQATFIEMEFD
ncbi:MAG: MBL fold metallo-hydrolase, partial [Rhodospirillales bacterium]|nr:MBL fold metallo-hydrolase [Rhodospirillales bacterium]